jgi:hypothetical protein
MKSVGMKICLSLLICAAGAASAAELKVSIIPTKPVDAYDLVGDSMSRVGSFMVDPKMIDQKVIVNDELGYVKIRLLAPGEPREYWVKRSRIALACDAQPMSPVIAERRGSSSHGGNAMGTSLTCADAKQ